MKMEPSFEIRKLTAKQKTDLRSMLEPGDAWKELMGIIPKTLKKEDYNAGTSTFKYSWQDIETIRSTASKHKKFCTDILLDEWGTSGRVRPALGHLCELLKKANLYRAADYVAVELLKQTPPVRPKHGPQAKVTPDANAEIEKILDEINYPNSAIENILQSSVKTNMNYTDKKFVIPEIVVSEVNEGSPTQAFNGPLVKNERTSNESNESDLIKFSSSSIEEQVNVPILSDLLRSEVEMEINIPDLSMLQNPSSSESISNAENEPNIPALSFLINPSTDNEQQNGALLPEVSILMGTALDLESSGIDFKSSSKTTSTRSCVSPLPNLFLNTPLPHYSYIDLEKATNNFDETPVEKGGHYLGSGAFANVYLALGLLDKQLAVKKLIIDVSSIDINDQVTKQFKTEVEVLSNYKHDNLLPLLGYSCDGCTYCLLYEFVPGGTLENRLKKKEDKLMWVLRFYIALGTAKAISYLHTALPAPLIHRDVKSANILLDSNNKPKLSDFGLIKLLESNQNTECETGTFGTSAYMPPEIFSGAISVKLDTFSFGVVLLELLTSLPPVDDSRADRDLVTYVEDSCDKSIRNLLDTSVGTWHVNNRNIAEEMYTIAQKCLLKNATERMNMVEVKTCLENIGQLV